MHCDIIETKRLILRKFTKDDLDAIFRIYSDPVVNTFLPWFPVKDKEDALKVFKERYESVYKSGKGYAYAICSKDDNIPIGYIKIEGNEPYDLGYGLLTEYWHQGYTSEAAKALILKAKEDGLSYITATHDRENPRSGSVMQCIGMSYKYSYEEHWMPKDKMVIFRFYQLNLDGNKERVFMGYMKEHKNHFVEEI